MWLRFVLLRPNRVFFGLFLLRVMQRCCIDIPSLPSSSDFFLPFISLVNTRVIGRWVVAKVLPCFLRDR